MPQRTAARERKLLVLDTSFSYRAIRERGLEASVVCRDIGGYFAHVWTVHPFSTMLDEDDAQRNGPASSHEIAPRHTFIEGRFGRFDALRRAPLLNFVVGQIALLARLVRLVRREGVDVVRTGDALYIGVLGWLVARLTGVPLVVRVGANYDKIYETTGQPMMPRLLRSRRIEKALERFVFPRADLVAGANEDNRDFAVANGAVRDRTTVFRYGNLIDELHFRSPDARADAGEILTELGIAERRFVLYVGRLEPVKHPDHVVRVLARLRADGHDVHAVLVGDGRMRDSLLELARELDVEATVHLCGNREQRWLASIIPHAGVVLSPHTGRALAETALGASAIVAYDVDWQRELVRDGETGFLVPHRDWQAMAARAATLFADPVRARQLGAAARDAALTMMDPARLDAHERRCYDALLARRAPPPDSAAVPATAPPPA